VIDSYAWIEHFLGTGKGRKVDNILQNADEVYTPDTVLAEVARKFVREGVKVKIVNEWLAQIVDASNIICLDTKLAINTAQCYLEMEANARKSKLNLPSLFDAVVLAISKSLNSKVLTGDQHFKDLPETVWIE
jgi:predicted nucleic acid-binding protein